MSHPEPPPASGFRLRARAVEAGLLRLPWHRPLAEWEGPELVDLERGIGRHVVRFVELGNGLYAVKELAPQLAQREYRLLVHLSGTNVPAVEPVGIVAERRDASGTALDSVLVTRYLEFSLPFRLVLARRSISEPEGVLLDGLAELLVRLHLAGVFWGDCSLSNTLFRRDAGALAAHLVDAETAEVHERLTDGQREHDLEVASENLSYELYDLACEVGWQPADEPTSLADEVLRRYERLWAELVSDEVFALDDVSRLERRLRPLNGLGVGAGEVAGVRGDGGDR